MPKLNVLNIQGQNVGEIELSDAVFGVEVNEHVLYEVVKNQLANKRQGTQSAKTRAEVRGGGRKPVSYTHLNDRRKKRKSTKNSL